MSLKIVAISDTHTSYPDLSPYSGDMIIHCGDFSSRGYEHEIRKFIQWYSKLNQFNYKILIAGNHDFWMEQNPEKAKAICENNGLIYFQNSGICIEGINFWGSPITPWFNSWAFNKMRGPEIRKYWKLIPNNTNILITHGPSAKIGKLSQVIPFGKEVGCFDLKDRVDEIKPKFHLFGHIHEGFGIHQNEFTTFINCSHYGSGKRRNLPVTFTYDSMACNKSQVIK